MKLIAVVGMSGTGKSVVTDYLCENNWTKLLEVDGRIGTHH